MRLMIDTQIFVLLAQDVLSLSHDVRELLSDYSNTLHISAESVKELEGDAAYWQWCFY